MTSEERRQDILCLFRENEEPMTGSELALRFHVTRQIIVKDIGLMKAKGIPIISTAKGYFLQKKAEIWKKRTITVSHDEKDMEDELKIIVDLGGRAINTHVNHPVYGQLGEELNIKSRKDIQLFLKKISDTGCAPLLHLTKGVHMHVIEAEDEKSLDEICEALHAAGYLISE